MPKPSRKQEIDLLARCQVDPKYFAEINLNISHWWEGMDRLCNAIARHNKVVVPSGHALSKDYTAGILALWFLYSYTPSKVVFTAPSIRQVSDVMWAEINSKHEASKTTLSGYKKHLYITIADNHFLTGFTTKEVKGQTGKFQGYHGPNVLMIFSEAQAIDDMIYEEAEGCLTADNNKMILLGNPLRTTGYFARAIDDPSFFKVELSCLDCPNVKEGKSIIPGMVSRSWVEDKRIQWERTGDPRWESRVLGKKPRISIDNVISQELIDRCKGIKPYYNIDVKVTSCDFARFGDDETIIYNWRNGVPTKLHKLAMSSGPESSAHAVVMSQENESTTLIGDADGLGGPVMDFIEKTFAHNDKIKVVPINSAGEATDKQYQNLKAEMWFHAREQLRLGMVSVPNDPMLIEELTETLYFYNKNGKVQIEAKEDIKERIQRSPDRADSWVMGVWAHKHEIWSRPKDQPYHDPYALRELEESETSFMSA